VGKIDLTPLRWRHIIPQGVDVLNIVDLHVCIDASLAEAVEYVSSLAREVTIERLHLIWAQTLAPPDGGYEQPSVSRAAALRALAGKTRDAISLDVQRTIDTMDVLELGACCGPLQTVKVDSYQMLTHAALMQMGVALPCVKTVDVHGVPFGDDVTMQSILHSLGQFGQAHSRRSVCVRYVLWGSGACSGTIMSRITGINRNASGCRVEFGL
jgi:hypothetical protein